MICAQEEQFKKISKKFVDVSAEFDMKCARLRGIIGYFEKLKATYVNYSKKITAATDSNFDRLLTPSPEQNPFGRSSIPLLQKSHISFFCTITEIVSYEVNTMITIIQEYMIVPLTSKTNDLEKMYEQALLSFNDVSSKRAQAQQQYIKDQTSLNESALKLEKLMAEYKSVLASQTAKPKAINKMRSDIASLIENYRSCLRNVEYSLYHLNSYHSVAVQTLQNSIKILTENDKFRVDYIYSVLSQIPQNYKLISDKYTSFIMNPSNYEDIWKKDFMAHVQNKGIVHTSYHGIEFQPFHFSFEDPQFFYPIVGSRSAVDFPHSIATVITNFDRNSIPANEDMKKIEHYILQVKQNDKVYVYDNKNLPWVLVSLAVSNSSDSNDNNNNNNSDCAKRKMGYIPSSYLEFQEETTTAVAKAVQLRISEEHLMIEPGEIVVIVEKMDDVTMVCINAKGEKGLVGKECLVIE